jgi:hypothetical protein
MSFLIHGFMSIAFMLQPSCELKLLCPFFLPAFIPLKRPNFFHIPESRLGLCASLMGGLVGGVMGLSPVGLLVLALSSVMPTPLPWPDPDRVASEPDSVEGADVDELVGCSLMEKRDLGDDVNGEGADCRKRASDEYEWGCVATTEWGGGEVREYRERRL